MTVGDKIRLFRQMRNYTQEVMADLLEMSQTGYAKLERNETELSISRLQQIAKVLDVSATDILGFNERNVFNSYASSQQIGSIANNYFQQLSEGERKQYELRIEHLEKEIAYLRSTLERLIQK